MFNQLLQKAMRLSQQLEQHQPLTAAQEKNVNSAAEALVRTLEIILKQVNGSPSNYHNSIVARLEAFELIIRPFFQRMLPILATLQNQFASSQSWFAYQTRLQAIQEVFTLVKLQKAIQAEAHIERVMLVSQMKDAREKNSFSARVTIIFEFDGPVIKGSYKVESPLAEMTVVKIETFENWYDYDDERLNKLVAEVGKEIRIIVRKNMY